MITLPFDSVPGTSKLFTDYCANTGEARKYFLGHFTDLDAYQAHLQLLEKRTIFREEIATILEKQNKAFESGSSTMEAIISFREPNTFAVFTGQQVGLFTGPLYTIYKALTAIQLAEWLADQFPAHNFVPVFWLETEDHDLEEANEAGFLTKSNEYMVVQNGEIDPEVKNLVPVGRIPLSETINDAIGRITEELQQTEFSESVLKTLAETYSEEASYGSAFPALFNRMYPDSGLIFFDPTDNGVKQFLTPVLMREIETFPVTSEEVISRSAELEEHYHAQVKPRALNLFFQHKDKRYAVEPSETDFFLRGSRRRLQKEELVELAENQPELFSSNVILRPIFQDYLFPTAAYVAGPAEVAYFAQLGPVYDHFQIPMPIIHPRASITLIEKKAMAVIEKYSLPFTSMFSSEDDLLKEILMSSGDNESSASEFQGIKESLDGALEQLYQFALGIDNNMKGPAESTVNNIRRSLTQFETKFFSMQKEQDQVTRRQVSKLLTHLCPKGKPQERMVNILTFYAKYGPGLLKKLEDISAPFPAEHRILLL